MTIRTPKAGDQITFLRSGMTVAVDTSVMRAGITTHRGMVLELTDKLIEANSDRHGFCYFSIADDVQAQQERWNEQRIAFGAVGGLTRWTPNSADETEARAAAVEAAYQLPPQERAAALAAVRQNFRPPSTQTSRWLAGDDIRNQMAAREAR